MKKMVYIVISVAGLLVAGLIFAGCRIPGDAGKASSLTGISLTQNHMNFGYCYSFYLREEEDKVLFDAEVRFDKEPYCIILEGCEVDKSYFDELRSLDEKNAVTSYVVSYKAKPSLFTASDETVNRTTVYLSDGTEKTAETKDEHIDVLYGFFFDLAKTYSHKSVASLAE